jgi:hypothetical protein
MDSQNNTLTLKEYPLFEWLFGLILLAACAFSSVNNNGEWTVPIVTGVIGILFFALSSILIVTADRTTGTLTIRSIGLLRRKVREVPIADITAVQLEAHDSSSSSGSSTTYRIVVMTRGGEAVPLRNSYSSGRLSKEARMKKLREFLGVGGMDTSLGGLMQMASGMAQQQFQQEQESITGSQTEEHITDGVHWNLSTKAMGGSPLTQWFSPDFKWDSNFLYLTQKMQGQGSQSGLMNMMGKMLFKTSLSLFGFPPDLTPGLDSANLLSPLDSQLEPSFMAFTSDTAGARQILNPWTAMPLAAWAQSHPMTGKNASEQTAILFSPQGLYIITMGLANQDYLDELSHMGAQLVKAQGNSTV